ncbi:hypothetical protein A1O3_09960 [Capronia epimyces CBS 606.96]|uniref:Uncharacterized protein n=1 Tax=Capronia epimyces CBS 606.96 TaxID=1182542 RepID=W9XL80_9EURO|nr:uncharacterized protein A1O3_09960 [Capronia epimyces CBS 606.96]EXJ77731.1 hypothetical protein A1O3_09960 [Capronia epimyces CBS 606.96]
MDSQHPYSSAQVPAGYAYASAEFDQYLAFGENQPTLQAHSLPSLHSQHGTKRRHQEMEQQGNLNAFQQHSSDHTMAQGQAVETDVLQQEINVLRQQYQALLQKHSTEIRQLRGVTQRYATEFQKSKSNGVRLLQENTRLKAYCNMLRGNFHFEVKPNGLLQPFLPTTGQLADFSNPMPPYMEDYMRRIPHNPQHAGQVILADPSCQLPQNNEPSAPLLLPRLTPRQTVDLTCDSDEDDTPAPVVSGYNPVSGTPVPPRNQTPGPIASSSSSSHSSPAAHNIEGAAPTVYAASDSGSLSSLPGPAGRLPTPPTSSAEDTSSPSPGPGPAKRVKRDYSTMTWMIPSGNEALNRAIGHLPGPETEMLHQQAAAARAAAMLASAPAKQSDRKAPAARKQSARAPAKKAALARAPTGAAAVPVPVPAPAPAPAPAATHTTVAMTTTTAQAAADEADTQADVTEEDVAEFADLWEEQEVATTAVQTDALDFDEAETQADVTEEDVTEFADLWEDQEGITTAMQTDAQDFDDDLF